MPTVHDFVHFMDEACARIAFLETQAKKSIAEENTAEYIKRMQEKAQFLAALPAEGEPYMLSLPATLRNLAQEGLQRFASSAQCALQLNSVFYMSALLFAEDHQDGQPNDLEQFTAAIRQSLVS